MVKYLLSIRSKLRAKRLYRDLVTLRGSVTLGKRCRFEGENVLSDGVAIDSAEVGYASYIGHNTVLNRVKIGRFSCIGSNVKIIVGNHPTSTFVSIHPAFYSANRRSSITYVRHQKFQEVSFADDAGHYLLIGNDVWVGTDVRLLSGIKIGDGAIIAAGAIVTKNVPPYAIVGGVPARLIRYRFDEDQIRALIEIKWWEKDTDWLKANCDCFEDISAFLHWYRETQRE